MNRTEYIKEVYNIIRDSSDELGYKLTHKQVVDVVDIAIETAKDILVSGEGIKIGGFLMFEVLDDPSHEAYNPRTGEKFMTEDKKKVKVKLSSQLKKLVANGGDSVE